MGRILAMDLGKKRIGLAISDALRITVQGLDTFHRGRVREDLEALAALVEERQVCWVVLGDPKNMDGSVSAQQEYTREFGGRLTKLTGVPVDYWDERLTSWEASRILGSSGKNTGKAAIDRMSAVLILEGYLQHMQQPTLDDGGEAE